jgi:hypothetical protein
MMEKIFEAIVAGARTWREIIHATAATDDDAEATYALASLLRNKRIVRRVRRGIVVYYPRTEKGT